MLLPFIKYVDFSIHANTILLIILVAILGFVGFFCINIAYKNCEISSVSPLLNISPLLLMVLAVIFLGEVISILQLIGIIVILVGGYIISLKDWKIFLHPFTALKFKYYMFVGGTIVAWSIAQLFMRIILMKTNIWTYLFFFSASVFVFSVIVVIFRRRGIIHIYKNHWRFIVLIEAFILISDIAHVFVFNMPGVMISLAMPVKRMSSLFIVLIGGTVFKEKKLLQKSVASVLMLVGLFAISFS